MCGTQSSPSRQDDSAIIPDCVPTTDLCLKAYTYARQNLHAAILHHSLRVWLIARILSKREQSISSLDEHHRDLLFAACILHDIGACSQHDGPQRFEVEAADVAKNLLIEHGINREAAHSVWIAIAIHTSPQIAERIDPLARLVRLAVVVDFKGSTYFPAIFSEAEAKVIEEQWPRLDIERILGDTVAEQGVRQPSKAPRSTWPGELCHFKQENPGWKGVNQAF